MINNLGKIITKKMSNNASVTTATQCQMRLSSSIGAAVSTLKGRHFISIDQLRCVSLLFDDVMMAICQ
jgi:hypothetical protein